MTKQKQHWHHGLTVSLLQTDCRFQVFNGDSSLCQCECPVVVSLGWNKRWWSSHGSTSLSFLEAEDHQYQTSLSYTVRPCIQIRTALWIIIGPWSLSSCRKQAAVKEAKSAQMRPGCYPSWIPTSFVFFEIMFVRSSRVSVTGGSLCHYISLWHANLLIWERD